MSVISREEYDRLHSKMKAYESARQAFDPKRFQKGGGYTPADVAQIEKAAGGKNATNDEKAKIEVYEFVHTPPDRYFAYYDKALTKISGWTGEKLGDIVGKGSEYKSPMGDKRINVKIRGINGVLYAGTCFLTSGDYCRMKKIKSSRLNPGTSGARGGQQMWDSWVSIAKTRGLEAARKHLEALSASTLRNFVAWNDHNSCFALFGADSTKECPDCNTVHTDLTTKDLVPAIMNQIEGEVPGAKSNPLTKRESRTILGRATKSVRDAARMAGNQNLSRLRSETAAYGAGLADAVSIAGPQNHRRHASKIVDASKAVIRGEERPFSELFGRPLRQFNPLVMTVMGNPYTLKGGDKQAIRNIVSRLSVGATDAEAADAVVAKLSVYAPAHVITAVRNYAAQCHRANQKLYGGVARGMNPGPKRLIKMSWDQWDEKFGPEMDVNGEYRWMDFDPTSMKRVMAAHKQRRAWTQIDVDGKIYIVEGVHFVNRLQYILTKKAYPAGAHFEIEDADMNRMSNPAPCQNPGHRHSRRNPVDYQDVYTAAQKVGFSVHDASRVASEFKRTGEMPRTVEAQLRYFRNPIEGWAVTKDGETLKTFPDATNDFPAAQFLHRYQGQSIDYAVRHGGYDIVCVRGGKVVYSYKREHLKERNPLTRQESTRALREARHYLNLSKTHKIASRAQKAVWAGEAIGLSKAAQHFGPDLQVRRVARRLGHSAALASGTMRDPLDPSLEMRRNPRKKRGGYLITGDDPGRGPWAIDHDTSKELLEHIHSIVKDELEEYIANVKEAGEEESDYDYADAVEFKDMLEGKIPFDFSALEGLLRAWKSTDSSCEIENIFNQNPLARGEAAQSLRMARHSIRTARRTADPMQRASLVGTALGISEVVRRHGPKQAKRAAGTFQSRTLASKNPGKPAGHCRTCGTKYVKHICGCQYCPKHWTACPRCIGPAAKAKEPQANPGKGTRRKVTMTLEAFAKMVKAKNDPKLWAAFLKKVEAYKKWSHGTLPKKVTVEQINVPGMSGMWMTYDAGKAPETAYVMPRGTKRKGAWVHQWDTMPDLKNDPESGIVLTKLKGKSRITDFYHR